MAYSPSRELEAFGRGLIDSLTKGMEEGRQAVERGEPMKPLSPETEAWLERTVKRSWWALYEDDDDVL